MEDKRQRARVQGDWAGPSKSKASVHPATTAKSHLRQKPSQTWKNQERHLSDREFVFKEPQQVVRRAPEPRVIDREGVYEISLSPTGVSRVCLYPGFVDLKEADWILEQLCQDVPWKQRTGIREDITYQQPRLTAWYGELPYTYSRVTMEPNPHWHPVLSTLKNHIEENTGHTFNSLLCNLYRNEKDSVDWHSDDEPSLGRCPIIASLSFGATRTFEMRKKPPPFHLLTNPLVVNDITILLVKLTIKKNYGDDDFKVCNFSGREWRLHICGKSEDTLGSWDLVNHGRSYPS
ncbi:alpha-ketoglutarate-dependent dioxygenase alkB homolog 3 isoform 1-T1 [Trichechus inunguis]